MSTFLHIILWLIIAAITLWALIFGGIGVAIARVRSKSLWSGFGWGFCFGPIGWVVLLLIGRSQQRDTIKGREAQPSGAYPGGTANPSERGLSKPLPTNDDGSLPDVI